MTTQDKKDNRAALLRLADELVDDILAASDEEILAEFEEIYGDPRAFAKDMQSKAELLAIGANKDRLISARQAMQSEAQRNFSTKKVNVDLARQALTKFFSKAPSSLPVTLAARKEKINEMSDTDVLSMLADLEALGFVLKSKSTGNKGK